MKKNMLSYIMITTILLTSNTYSFAKTTASINIDNIMQPTSSNIINKDGHTLVAFRDLFSMLGADVDWNHVKRTITAKKNDKTLVINVDTNNATLNNKPISMPVDVEIIDGATYVPLRFACEAFGMTVDWNLEKKKISINTGNKDYIYLNDILPNSSNSISLEDAVLKAKKNNSSLKNLTDAEKYQEKIMTNLNTQISIIYDYDASMELLLRSARELESQLKTNDLTEKIIADGIEFSVINTASNIESTKLNILALEESINLQKENIKNLELKYNYGMISENSLKEAKTSLKNNEISLTSLNLLLSSQNQILKDILGESLDKNINISLNKDFTQLDDINIEAYITRSIEGDISIQISKKNLEIAEKNLSEYSVFSSSEDKLKAENEIKSQQRKLSNAKSDLENKIRNSYNELLKIKDKDKSLNLALENAIDDYNKVVANYEAGNATMYQVKQAKLGILNAEKEIEINKINFSISLFGFNKPYLL